MNVTKSMKTLGFFALVVVVSMATNLTTNRFNVSKVDRNFTQGFEAPASYAKFASASSAMETDFTVAAELSIHAVVHVKTKTPVRQISMGSDPFFEYFFGRPQQPNRQEMPMQEGSGSGVIISEDGYIVTNNHVVDNSKEIEVTLNDNRTFKAKLIGADPNTDIALIKIDAEKLPVIIFGNSDSLKVGEWVLAVGNPFNLTSTVTAGIVSAKARNINIINSQMKIESFIQTDAAVNPGNSGGALVNTKGELVGVNTAIASQTGSYAGYAFAVPVSIVQKVVTDIRQYGVVQRAILGVSMGVVNDSIAKSKKLKSMDGAFVAEVIENSAAEKAGIKKEDVIVKVNGVDVKTPTQLQEQIGRFSPGDKVMITVMRDNKLVTVSAELKNRQGNTKLVSSEAGLEVLGATFTDVNDKVKNQLGLKYGIEIKSLKQGKLSEKGVKSGFIILKINNQTIKSDEDVQAVYDAAINNGEDEKVLFIAGVYPNGRVTYYAIDLADGTGNLK